MSLRGLFVCLFRLVTIFSYSLKPNPSIGLDPNYLLLMVFLNKVCKNVNLKKISIILDQIEILIKVDLTTVAIQKVFKINLDKKNK